MLAGTLKMWRAVMRLTQEAAAEHIGISRRMYQAYEAGTNEIPLTVALACTARFANLGEWLPAPPKKSLPEKPRLTYISKEELILRSQILQPSPASSKEKA